MSMNRIEEEERREADLKLFVHGVLENRKERNTPKKLGGDREYGRYRHTFFKIWY